MKTASLTKPQRAFGILSAVLIGLCSLIPLSGYAQNTVYFSTSGAGVTKSIAQWGVDVSSWNSDIMREDIATMGIDQMSVIRIWCPMDPVQADGTLPSNSRSGIDSQLSITAMAGLKPLTLASGGSTDPWYVTSTGSVQVNHWVQEFQATQQYVAQQYNKSIAAVEPFNEPDYWPGEGSSQDLHDIMVGLRSLPAFQNTALMGASTLNSNAAQAWYDPIASVATEGSTHVLAGNANSYANFFQHVTASGGIPAAPEMHGLGEAMYAAQYGAQLGIWWDVVPLARGLFVQSSQGKQLGYAENRGNDTAAAVYRAGRQPPGVRRRF